MAVTAVAFGALLLTACGGGAATDSSAAASSETGSCGTEVPFDPASFVDPTRDTNPFHPLEARSAVGPWRVDAGRWP